MKNHPLITSLFIAAASLPSHGADISIQLTNLTHGSYFTPFFLSSHSSEEHFFQIGESASSALQAMAEGGSIDDLVAQSDSMGAESQANPAEGLLAPGASFSINDWNTGSNTHLSVTAMILPSNDGFVGLDSWEIPSEPGTYTIMLNGYDAGTEANDEIVNGGGAPGAAGIPANPGMNGGENGTGITTEETNSTVHIHRGIIGDTDLSGGASDLDSRIHRWLNPIARLVVTVK